MNAFTKARRAVIYARLSVTAEESVSIERQIEACRKYCEARGMEVIHDPFIDDGVSATKARPEHRVGWRQVMELKKDYDVVVVWKVDRLARRVLDFLHADEALQSRGAALMAVEDPIDMSTAQGRAFATMLAVFGEMEAAAISARVTDARRHLTANGRVAGGERPWPYSLAPNPHGHGYVLDPIPERAEVIKQAAVALIAGKTNVAAIGRRWDAAGFGPKGKRAKEGEETTWHPSSVRALLRNPTLYGATIYRDSLLRNQDGSIKIGPHAILDRGTWELMVKALAGEKKGRKVVDPPLLHGIAICDTCEVHLGVHRPTTRPESNWKYLCRNRLCPDKVYVSMERLDDHVSKDFLRYYGRQTKKVPVGGATPPDPVALAELEAQLLDVDDALNLTDDDDEALRLVQRRRELRRDLANIRDAADAEVTWRDTGETVADGFRDLDKNEKRELMKTLAQPRVTVKPGERGRHGLDLDRIEITYRKPALPRQAQEEEGAGHE